MSERGSAYNAPPYPSPNPSRRHLVPASQRCIFSRFEKLDFVVGSVSFVLVADALS